MHITAKPTSYQCNLQCDYCFYLDKEAQFTHSPRMDDQTLKTFIKSYIDASGEVVYFTWQGGEPTLAGLDFFRKAVTWQQQFSGSKKIHNALQTNGVLLNDEWCRFLKKHNFLIGISIDGPEELHNRYRVTRSGKGTFQKVMAAIERLKEHQIEFNTLTVINNINVHHPLDVYEFLKEIGSRHMQFIELLETSESNISFTHSLDTFRLIDFSVPSADYGRFMSAIFKVWVKKDVGKIFIRQFESTLSRVLGNGHTSCIFQEVCHNNFVIESNGDMYECDHFVWPEYRIGNIASDSLNAMESTKLTAQKQVLAQECINCSYRPLCNGGCPKHRISGGTGARISYFCQGYKIMFSSMTPYLNAFVELARHGIPLEHIMLINNELSECCISRQDTY
ncbi:anaerobic sulfatase maturase [Salmonella enterica]